MLKHFCDKDSLSPHVPLSAQSVRSQQSTGHLRWQHTQVMIVCVLLQWLVLSICHAQYGLPGIALYYGTQPNPVLRLYDKVIVQPNQAIEPKTFDTTYRKAFAYVSLGETYAVDFYQKPIQSSWILGENHAWHTLIMDQTNPAWQNFFLETVIEDLWQQGYRGFYLDTLDSYKQMTQDPASQKRQLSGLIATIRAIKHKHPEAALILNRGFELLPSVHTLIDSITVESVFSGWDNKQQRYFTVPESQRHFVVNDIRTAQKMGVPVTIIDYVAPENRDKAPVIAQRIRDLGCAPWVTDAALTEIYLQPNAALPRKVLIFYRGPYKNADDKIGSPAVKYLSMPLNHLGYAVEVRNINAPLPNDLSSHTYAGIIISIDGILLERQQELHDWYLKQIQRHIPLLILNDFGFMLSNENLKAFGLSVPLLTHQAHTEKIVSQSSWIGYEISPILNASNTIAIQILPHQGKSLLQVENGIGLRYDIAGLMPWGGYYAGQSFLPAVEEGQYRWAINPYEFFKQALKLPDIPIPDTTTENGRRLMFAHVDGDGFANKGEWYNAPYTSEVMRDNILKTYQLPTTVSVIQGEIAANGLHPQQAKTLEDIARSIFTLPYVEIASHTFSHPFNWQDALKFKDKNKNPYTLPIPHYHFDLQTEINGSVDYINHQLAPKDKPCRMFLWSGEGDVPEQALHLVKQLGLRNINPGTIITQYNPSLTRISALGVNEGKDFQIFAPIGNDQEIQGVAGNQRLFYSNINIIYALKLTEHPKRLKPIDIYTHFFTLAQPGGLKALQAVYDWVLTQPILPIFTSEYSDIVTDFNQLLLIPVQDNADTGKPQRFIIASNDALRELRVPISYGYPDFVNSRHIVGMSEYNHQRYIHLAPGGDALIQFTKKPQEIPYLVSANARLLHVDNTSFQHIRYTFKGFLPIEFVMANTENCQVYEQNTQIKPSQNAHHMQHYALTTKHTAEVSIQCH